jgi:hypothetical protein
MQVIITQDLMDKWTPHDHSSVLVDLIVNTLPLLPKLVDLRLPYMYMKENRMIESLARMTNLQRLDIGYLSSYPLMSLVVSPLPLLSLTKLTAFGILIPSRSKSLPRYPLQPMGDIFAFISTLPLLTDLHLYGDPKAKQIEQLLHSILNVASLPDVVGISTLHLGYLHDDTNGFFANEVPTKWRRSIYLRSSDHHQHTKNTHFSDDIHELIRDLVTVPPS